VSHDVTRRVLVIGYGNPLRGDDGLGRVIAARVAESARPQGIEVVVAHQLTPELAESISRADLVIFVDAAADLPPGQIRILPVVADTPCGHGSFAHHCTPNQLLTAAQALYAHRPEAWAITVGGECWDYSETLSPAVERLVPRLLHYIDLLVAVRLPAPAESEATHA
jgi:hydrogenase maturation protease